MIIPVSHFKKPSPVICILGGAGAYASLFCHANLLDQWAKIRKPEDDCDYPEIFHWSLPQMGIDSQGNLPVKLFSTLSGTIALLKQHLQRYHSGQACHLLFPCNAGQAILRELLRHDSQLIFHSLLESGSTFEPGALILASKYSREHDLFHIAKSNCKYVEGDNAQFIDNLIEDVVKGKFNQTIPFIKWLEQQSQQVVLACSELSAFGLKVDICSTYTHVVDTIVLTNEKLVNQLNKP